MTTLTLQAFGQKHRHHVLDLPPFLSVSPPIHQQISLLPSFHVTPLTSLTLEPSPVVFLWFIIAAAVSTTGPHGLFISRQASAHVTSLLRSHSMALQLRRALQRHHACRAFQHWAPPVDMSPWSSPSKHAPPPGLSHWLLHQLKYPACSSPTSSFPGLLRGPLGGGASVPNQPLRSQHCPSPALSSSPAFITFWNTLHPLFAYCLPLTTVELSGAGGLLHIPRPSIACGTLELP